MHIFVLYDFKLHITGFKYILVFWLYFIFDNKYYYHYIVYVNTIKISTLHSLVTEIHSFCVLFLCII